MFTHVYDWIGGPVPSPEQFQLQDYRGGVLVQDSECSGVFNMADYVVVLNLLVWVLLKIWVHKLSLRMLFQLHIK